MTELVRPDVEVLEIDDPVDAAGDPFSPPKLVGVALLGAVASLFIYSLWVQLDPDRKDQLKESLVGAVKSQVRNWSDTDEA